MALNIDSSRAMRSPLELADLVQAILAGTPNDESTWIEWKNGLDLNGKAGQVMVARQILGMANRSPEVASRHAEGLSYIVIGAEPGNCGGVIELDPADLDAALRPYLGSEGPRWSPQYVKIQGKSVLVITVDPPKRGDRAFMLQREYDKYRAGAIFVRHVGRTDQADPGDIRMLEDRYAATVQPISLYVRPVGADDSVVVRPIGNLDALLDAWGSRVRRELMPPPPPPSRAASREELDLSGLAGLDQALKLMADNSRLMGALGGLVEEDRRTDAQFEAEVEQYVKDSRDHYGQVARARLAQQGASLLSLQLVNTSDRNYENVRVELLIPPSMQVAEPDRASSLPAAPERPRARGERSTRSLFSTMETDYRPFLLPRVLAGSPRFWVDRDANGTTVTYDVGRARAEQRISLEPDLFLEILGDAASGSEISWAATASNVDGIARGGLAIRVGEPVGAEDLIPEILPQTDR